MAGANRYWTLADGPVPNWPQADTFVLNRGRDPGARSRPGAHAAPSTSPSIPTSGATRSGAPSPRAYAVPCAHRLAGDREPHGRASRPATSSSTPTAGPSTRLMGEGVWRPAYMVPRKLDPALGRISQAVGVLGMLGLTAYAGMDLMADPKPGETVVVSAASGGVGQIAGQLARLRGARVVGIAGREAKCRFVVDELGYDACVSHLSPEPRRPTSRRPVRRGRRLLRERRRGGVRGGAAALQPGRADDDLRPDRPLWRRRRERHPRGADGAGRADLQGTRRRR